MKFFSLNTRKVLDAFPTHTADLHDDGWKTLALDGGAETVLRIRHDEERGFSVAPCADYDGAALDALGGFNRFPYEKTMVHSLPPLRLIVLNDATVAGDACCVVDDAGTLVLESLWPALRDAPFLHLGGLPSLRALRDGPADGGLVEVSGPTVLLCHHSCNNYYHWHQDALGIVTFLKEVNLLDSVRLAVPTLRPWQRRSLELLGVGADRLVELGNRPHRFSRLIVTSMTFEPTWFPGRWTASTYAAILGALRGGAEPEDRAGGDRIYLSRRDSGARLLIEEGALIDRLSAAGFTILEASALSYDQQVLAFAKAGFVVGSHGAGLTNLGFCRRSTVVLELFPHGFLSAPHYFVLSRALGIDYHMHVSRLVGGGNTHVSWSLDVDQAMARVHHLHRQAFGAGLPGGNAPDRAWTGPLHIDFRANAIGGTPASFTGFSNAEDWGTWMDGTLASITFDAPLPERVRLSCVLSLFKPGLSQGLRFRLGNELLPLDADGCLDRIDLTFENPDGERVLWIEAPGACSPASQEAGSGDHRILSVGFQRMDVYADALAAPQVAPPAVE
ncbi:glycosyltransferase 61 family protein [Azospirillum formosense]|uniref:glycosyltransferase family 61 protein n=1 Tax=Azospirillum formosense TaxID=861533 RepID=UPI0033905CBC